MCTKSIEETFNNNNDDDYYRRNLFWEGIIIIITKLNLIFDDILKTKMKKIKFKINRRRMHVSIFYYLTHIYKFNDEKKPSRLQQDID